MSILNERIQFLGFDTRTLNALNQYHIGSDKKKPIIFVKDLIVITENELLKQPNIGRKSLNDLKQILSLHNLKLGMSEKKLNLNFLISELTIRDYFSAKAMQTFLINTKYEKENIVNLAVMSYFVADVMMENRE